MATIILTLQMVDARRSSTLDLSEHIAMESPFVPCLHSECCMRIPGVLSLWLLLLLCLWSTVSPSFAQVDQSHFLSATSVGTSSTNYYFARPNELTIIVNVLGFVARPGRYEISNSIDLMNLLALAGGPTADGALDDIKITRLVKTDSGFERKEMRVNLDELPEVDAADLVLHPGDVIQVDRTGWATFRDVIGVVTTAAIIASAVINVANLVRD